MAAHGRERGLTFVLLMASEPLAAKASTADEEEGDAPPR